ncbi:MAG: hypothetical protein ACYTG0_18050 [Planctomycetota bacterium]
MNANLEKVKAIFLEAVEKYDPEQWGSYLDEACGEDQKVRRNVEILLDAHASGESLLDKGAIAADATIDQPIPEGPGTVIGPYKLLQKIGEGGFGVVYMADQKEPVKRRVALKIKNAGTHDRIPACDGKLTLCFVNGARTRLDGDRYDSFNLEKKAQQSWTKRRQP